MKNSSIKYLTILIIFYMLAALAWWTVLLLKFNAMSYTLAQTADTSLLTTEAISDFEKNKKMILGEGLVFAVALITGVYLLYRSYKRELETSKRQNNFLMSVTHELKTPLSVMKLSNETMRSRKLDSDTLNNLLNIDQKEISRLELLINNLLLSSKMDNSHNARDENLTAFLKTRANLFNSRSSRRILFKHQNDIQYPIDKNLFAIAVDNLLDNAIKYSDSDVELELKKSETQVEISIKDCGQGIPKSEKENVFQKFYRIGDENIRTTQGTGLGLFLSKSIVEAHGGTISIRDNSPKGTVFTIHLNLK